MTPARAATGAVPARAAFGWTAALRDVDVAAVAGTVAERDAADVVAARDGCAAAAGCLATAERLGACWAAAAGCRTAARVGVTAMRDVCSCATDAPKINGNMHRNATSLNVFFMILSYSYRFIISKIGNLAQGLFLFCKLDKRYL